MPQERMGHALEQIHWLLKPGGRLIDIHPSGEPPPVMVAVGSVEHLAGWVEEASDYQEYEWATAALASAEARHLFTTQRRNPFTHITECDTLDDLTCYFERDWHDASISHPTTRAIEDWSRTTGYHQIIVREHILMSCLQRKG